MKSKLIDSQLVKECNYNIYIVKNEKQLPKNFKIKTRLRYGDALKSTVTNIVFEEVIKTITISQENIAVWTMEGGSSKTHTLDFTLFVALKYFFFFI